ncbi:MAG: TlpA family protein disulfide reductase [Planctomycetota bacterium]|nr:MAG: TlpA family protein disulfide reductase [Planctomycetota bacterium]REJ98442.1 MAG: TlpA family protein disulfide reductase [Planctomycetota bacterium]REK23643.1 MAG: TlpA family protein disulfide reductase [Planctomycetota bacterium]REK31130.1 MAG: TlpA family protein disulfide reductase [Planctomycetota bacterium]
MLQLQSLRTWTLLTAAVAVLGFASHHVLADDESRQDSPQPEAQDSDQPEAEEEEVDPYAVPEEASSEEVSLLIRRFMRMTPESRSPDAFLEHFSKINESTDKILALELDEETMLQAVQLKFGVLTLLDRLGVEDAAEKRQEFAVAISKDERPAVAAEGRKLALLGRVQQVPALSGEEQQQLIDDVAAYLQDGPIEGDHLGIAMQTASGLEYSNPELAVDAYNLFAKYIESAEDPQLAAYAESMRGAARRLDLPGNEIKITGTTLDGEPFDIKDLKGKVVLVDFWATWCGYCIEEFPNIRENYEKYHDQGFEVVGVNLDEEPETVVEFLENEPVPWMTLIEPEAENRGVEGNPNASYYGITGIPQAILVGKDGKVITIRARGDELTMHLDEIFKSDDPAGE